MSRDIQRRLERVEAASRRDRSPRLAPREPREAGARETGFDWRSTGVMDATLIAGHLGGWTPADDPIASFNAGMRAFGYVCQDMAITVSQTRQAAVKAAGINEGPHGILVFPTAHDLAFRALGEEALPLVHAMNDAFMARPKLAWWKPTVAQREILSPSDAVEATISLAGMVSWALQVDLFGTVCDYAPAPRSVAEAWENLDAALRGRAWTSAQENRIKEASISAGEVDREGNGWTAYMQDDDVLAIMTAQLLDNPDRMDVADLSAKAEGRARALWEAVEATH